MNYTTETDLFEGLQGQGFEQCWSYFYHKYSRLIVNFSLRKGIPPEDTHDILQETMLDLYMALPTFQYDQTKGKFRNFVIKIASRKCARYFDRKKRHPEPEDPEKFERLLHETDSLPGSDTTGVAADPEIQLILVSDALDMLLEQNSIRKSSYEAYRHYVIENMSAAMVAKKLGMTLGQVYRIKNRINPMLKECLETSDGMDEAMLSSSCDSTAAVSA